MDIFAPPCERLVEVLGQYWHIHVHCNLGLGGIVMKHRGSTTCEGAKWRIYLLQKVRNIMDLKWWEMEIECLRHK